MSRNHEQPQHQFHLCRQMLQREDRTNMEIHLNSKISRQLIKCRSAWLAWSCQERSHSLCLSVRGFTHSGGARRIKASPTGQPDKPDQKEHTEKRGSSGLQGGESKSHESTNQPASQPAPHHHPSLLPHKQNQGSNKDALGQQHCWVWHCYSCVCFCSFRLRLHFSPHPLAQLYQGPNGSCSARLPRLHEPQLQEGDRGSSSGPEKHSLHTGALLITTDLMAASQ